MSGWFFTLKSKTSQSPQAWKHAGTKCKSFANGHLGKIVKGTSLISNSRLDGKDKRHWSLVQSIYCSLQVSFPTLLSVII